MANGVDPRGRPAEDCWDIAAMLVRTGRAVHPEQWVAEYVERAGLESLESLM